ncbi:MAG: MBL fold metallo-hydrolase [Halorientalis sp.]
MATEVVSGVWALDLGFVPPLEANAYLVDDRAGLGSGEAGATDGDTAGTDTERGVTLVDAGLRWNYRSLRAELASAGYGAADVDRVLLTHYDLDHTWGLHGIADDLAGPVYIGAADGRLVDGDDDPPLVHHKGLFHRVARRVAPLPAGLTVEHVEDGDRVGPFTAHHTPGHNPGHTVYVHDDGVGFLGDLVWEEDGEFTPPIRFDSYDVGQIHESIRAFAARGPDFETACMGHGEPMATGGAETLDRLAARL